MQECDRKCIWCYCSYRGRDVELSVAKFLSLLLLLEIIIIIVIKSISRGSHSCLVNFFPCRLLGRTQKHHKHRRAACCQLLIGRTHTHYIASARLERISFFVSGRHVQASDFSVRRNSNYIYTLCDNYPLEGKLSVMREMRGSDFRVVFITGNAPLECQ
jgi:hypothetical protein